MIPQQVAYRCLGRLDLLEFRRLGHAAADVEADRPEQEAEEERHPPAPGQKLRLGQGAGQHNTEDRGNDGGQPLARPLPAGEKAFAGLGMLDQEGGGAAEFAADRKALQQPRDQHQGRRGDVDCRVGRHHRHHRGADHHHRDRQGEPGAAAVPVGIGADHDRAQRPHDIGEAEGGKGDEQRDGAVADREEQL